MDVQLYVYDISRGMARSMSRAFLGTQIDAVYHTSVVFDGVEYFYGMGIQRSYPGATHHGNPMEIIPMGQTSLSSDIVIEYLESLRQIYSPETYDLFAHNCNNFTNDFCMFLTGKRIPEHITSLPETVLNTPFGQMLRPQIDAAMRPITQASIPPQKLPRQEQIQVANGTTTVPAASNTDLSVVQIVSTMEKLDRLLREAKSGCAVIFFTSSTCPPCKMVYPTYDELAAEAGSKATLIKIDTNDAPDIAAKYSIRATPTFMAFLKGKHEETWSGANPAQLSGNVRLLIQAAFPPHPHRLLSLSTFHRRSVQPVLYTKIPPLDKLVAKLGSVDPIIKSIIEFITIRSQKDAKEATLPDLAAFAAYLRTSLDTIPKEILFAIYDLLRLTLTDQRVSAYFLEQDQLTIPLMLKHVTDLEDCPYNLKLVATHAACNLFSSRFATRVFFSIANYYEEVISMAISGLLDKDHSNVRIAAGSLAYNLSTLLYKARTSADKAAKPVEVPQDAQVELTASLVQSISDETNQEAIKVSVLALARLAYSAPEEGEVLDLCRAFEAKQAVTAKRQLIGDNALSDDIEKLFS